MSRHLTVYIRSGCHLCGDMLYELKLRQDALGFTLETIDIQDQPALESLYGTKVPVLIRGEEEVCHYFLDEVALKQCFEAS